MIIGENKVTATIAELAYQLQVEYPTATAIVKLMISQGAAKEVGKRPSPNGKGKPATIYELSSKFSLDFVTLQYEVPKVEPVPVNDEPAARTIANRVADKPNVKAESTVRIDEARVETKAA